MKAIIKFIKQSALPFIKKNIFSCLCLLLSALVALTGSISYSKYISTDNVNKKPGAGSFSCSASIDGVSALSFTNTAFWGGTVADDKIAMNALRSINFSVNNWEVVNGEEKVSEVKMNYNLTFSAPVNFVERLAIQLFDEADDPMLPQLVLIDLIHAGQHNHLFQTATSDDFNSVYHHDLTFTTQKNGDDYTAIFDGHIHEEAVKVVIKLEKYEQSTHQLLHFRTWDTSDVSSAEKPKVEDEGGKLLPPLQVKFTRTIPFYRIVIHMSNMILPAGEKATRKHSIHLAPTNTLDDDHLAGYFVSKQGGNYEPVTSIYGVDADAPSGSYVSYEMQTVKEESTDSYYNTDKAFNNPNVDGYKKLNHFNEHIVIDHDQNLVGSVHYYEKDEIGTFDNTRTTSLVEMGSFVHQDREYIDKEYLYLKRTENAGGEQWQLIGINNEGIPAVRDEKDTYYRLFVNYGEIIIQTEAKLTNGVLKTEVDSVDDYTVKSVSKNAEDTHYDIVLNITSHDLLRYTLLKGATGTRTITKILDIEEEGLILEVGTKNGASWNWGATDKHILKPNFNIAPWVYATNTYTNTGADVILYEYDNTDYIIRELQRDISRVDIMVEEVTTTIIDGEGKPQVVRYTQSNPLEMFGDDGLQKIYLSQCYSKNYPFYVNVIFEQVQ